ncbi:DUF1501 domain-containing protein [Lentisphaera profundi]|uniref:DUF1501 domain-containing protein n=1 Tax=Lentisphaera profundi TaxID=1658616 RepID=A0ABY7VYW4_9BACT|nr:DUF1501 domain-containing protein [Lentisphaera profundi]WDE99375.1 DUF1501 domain-containing protein [Lentisphaera profundi]
MNRRDVLKSGLGLGTMALTGLQNNVFANNGGISHDFKLPGLPKAKRVIYLFMAGGPSHIDTFDFHPEMRKLHGTELPDSIRNGQRITGMTSGQKSFPCVAPMHQFHKHGEMQTWVSEYLPHTAKMVDKLSIIKTMNTEAVNHDPAITYINTGNQIVGHPSLGSWLSYGIGSQNQNLPSYVTMISRGSGNGQALYSRLWGSGNLPSKHAGVKLRSGKEAVLYLDNPKGVTRSSRRDLLNTLGDFNRSHYKDIRDPEIDARIAQYEMAYRMQSEVPDTLDMTKESKATLDLYGPDVLKPGTFANNCIKARKLSENGVRFIQLFHRNWDHHSSLPKHMPKQCNMIDQPSMGLLKDLESRGLLDDTLVIWGGEFGRTIYSQGKLTKTDHGRDHHGRCFTYWMAGGGVKQGYEHGVTDEYAYNILDKPVHINDFNATVLHLLGINHEKFSVKHQGLDLRLTGVEPRKVIHDIIA